jgi:hypothetical protein
MTNPNYGSTTTIRNAGRTMMRRINRRGPKSRTIEQGTRTSTGAPGDAALVGHDDNGHYPNNKDKKYKPNMEQIPSLKQFMHVQKVKHQYREFLRATKYITDLVFQHQAKNEIRQSYDSVKKDSDSLSISMAFQEVSCFYNKNIFESMFINIITTIDSI